MQIMKSIVEGAQRDQWLRIWLECMNQIVCRCGDLLFYARIIRRITFREALTDLKWLYHSTSFGIHCNAVVTSQCQLNDVSKLTMSDIQRVLHPSTSSAIKIHQLFSYHPPHQCLHFSFTFINISIWKSRALIWESRAPSQSSFVDFNL